MNEEIRKYYGILGIDAEASDQDVNDLYGFIVNSYKDYPSLAPAKIQEINEAYEKIMAHRKAMKQHPVEAIKSYATQKVTQEKHERRGEDKISHDNKQKKLLMAVITVVVAMLLFPPFYFRAANGVKLNKGYAFLFSPPTLSNGILCSVDVGMLLTQLLIVLIVGGIAFLLTKDASLPLGLSSKQSIVTTPPIEKPKEKIISYAGFWKRLAAFLIDIIITTIGLIAVIICFGIMFGGGTLDTNAWERMGSFFGLIGCWLYYALMESSSKQATLGKMALEIKVTDLNGSKIDFGKATGRYFGKIISAFILCIGFIMVAFTQKKQGLHDIMAGCLVVNRAFEIATNNDAYMEKIFREADARSVKESRKTAAYSASEKTQQNDDFIALLKSAVNENRLETIANKELYEICNRARTLDALSNKLDIDFIMAVNKLSEEIKKRGLSQENKPREISNYCDSSIKKNKKAVGIPKRYYAIPIIVFITTIIVVIALAVIFFT